MNIIRRLKPLLSQLKTGYNDVISWSGYWTRILLYGSVLVSFVLPTYDFQVHQFSIFPEQNAKQKAKQTEVKQYIASFNKGQQAYFYENGKFTNSIAKLGLGIKTETSNYSYNILASNGPIQTLNNNTNMLPYFESVTTFADPKSILRPSYIGVVFAIKNNQKGADSITTISAICEINRYNYFSSTLPTLSANLEVLCPPNSKILIMERNGDFQQM